MNIERLVYGRQGAIESYAAFDRRCRTFISTYAPPTVPTDQILREMFLRWINQPDLSGYFVSIDNSNRSIGHIASWVVNFYGQLRLFIWQVEIDSSFIDTQKKGLMAMLKWIEGLNCQLPPGQKIELAELSTWHDPKVFLRYLRKAGLEPVLTTSTIQCQI